MTSPKQIVPEGLPEKFPQDEIKNYLDCKQVFFNGHIYTIPRMTATHKAGETQIAFVVATDGNTYAIETKGVSMRAFKVVEHKKEDLTKV